jgi:ectoine hydroxylase-related dioxygenase (phytanoyl-CoA dioxygenase family)
MSSYTEELDCLAEKGYCVIENILTAEEVETAIGYFRTWFSSHPQIEATHNKISPHGIIKYHEVGHQRHSWYIRTRPAVQNVFKEIWKTDEVVVSYDSTGYISADCKKKDNIWTHTDQAPIKKGLKCIQGFVALTDNIERTLVVYEGSHKLHEEYAKEYNLTSTKDWLLIEHEYLEKISDRKRVLNVKAGSLVLWDSRTFHQNQYGNGNNYSNNNKEERIVQYVSYLPRSNLSKKMLEKRRKYFAEKRTTSHWAYPVKVNGLQPQNYGDKTLNINYSELATPQLEDLLEEIVKLV